MLSINFIYNMYFKEQKPKYHNYSSTEDYDIEELYINHSFTTDKTNTNILFTNKQIEEKKQTDEYVYNISEFDMLVTEKSDLWIQIPITIIIFVVVSIYI